MRFWDRITGGAATVTIELDKPLYMPGETVNVRATVTANGDFEAKSALVSLWGEEEVRFSVPRLDDEGHQVGQQDEYEQNRTVRAEQRLPGPIKLGAGQQHAIEAQLHVPLNAPPTYAGPKATHSYNLKVELDVAWSANSGQTVTFAVGLAGPDA